jgi:ABC-type multidrug transport system permease subunit
MWNDRTSKITEFCGILFMSLIIGSIFYQMAVSTRGFSAKGGVLFFVILLNALTLHVEIKNLFDQRPIVEKHASYA